MLRDEMTKTKFCVNWERAMTNLENETPKENLATGSCDVLQRSQKRREAKGDESKINTKNGALQISFFAGVGPQGQRELAAKYTREGEIHDKESR